MDQTTNLITVDVDTLRYRVQLQRTLPQEDVRLSVDVTALVSTAGQERQNLDLRIREALERFVTANWVFSTVRRLGDAVGYERVMLRANTRVPVAEVWNLEERARAASQEGLALSDPKADYSLPAARVSTVVQDLRIAAIEEIKSQIAQFDHTTGRAWRIGAIQFGVGDDGSIRQQTSKGAYRSAGIGDLDNDDSGLGGTERITLVAEVVLKARPDPAAQPA